MSYGLGDAQGYYRRRPADRAFRTFKACGHVVETRGSDNRYPSHGRLAEYITLNGETTCPVCTGAREFRQYQLRVVDGNGDTSQRWVTDERHARNLANMLFRENVAVMAELLINEVGTGIQWRAAQ